MLRMRACPIFSAHANGVAPHPPPTHPRPHRRTLAPTPRDPNGRRNAGSHRWMNRSQNGGAGRSSRSLENLRRREGVTGAAAAARILGENAARDKVLDVAQGRIVRAFGEFGPFDG